MELDLCGAALRVGIHFGALSPELGGGYTYVAELMRAFAEVASSSPHDYVIFNTQKRTQAVSFRVEAANVTMVPVRSRSRLERLIVGLKYLSPVFRQIWRRPGTIEREARKYNVQLLWFVGLGLHEPPDLPYIATILDLQHRLQPFFPEVSASGEWDRRESLYGHFLRRAAYCITGTETGKRETQHLYQIAEPRMRVLGLATPEFALNAKASTINVGTRFGIEREYVFYPAQLWPHKNHANLILAIKWLKESKNLYVGLALSGVDKGNRSFLKRFAEHHGMSDQVHFLGFVTREELVGLYQQALALTYVTLFGPDNIPPLEAFALGCPVIASAVDGASEQYGDAVLHVDPANPASIGQAIWSLHCDPELRSKLVHAGLERASQWTATDYVREMFTLFDEFSAIRRNWE